MSVADWSQPSARVIADSISAIDGSRLVTVEMRHHRFVLAEANTHGSAKNSASSRAIPTAKLVAGVLTDIAMPVEFGSLKPGMQAGPALEGDRLAQAELVWIRGALRAVETTLELLLSPDMVRDGLRRHAARSLTELAGVDLRYIGATLAQWHKNRERVARFVTELIESGENSDTAELLRVHKQVANRPLEPYMWHTAVHTAIFDGVDLSSWVNFMAQRCSPTDGSKSLAQPEFTAVADRIRDALTDSTPTEVMVGGWHLPYLHHDEHTLLMPSRIALAIARIARTSYLSQNGLRELAEDFRLFVRLATANPPHWSPFEHIATPVDASAPGRYRTWRSVRHSTPELRAELLAHASRQLDEAAA